MREYFNPRLRRWFVQLEDGRWQYRYRWMIEQEIGRKLRTDEHVHHINGDQTDDRRENLQVLSAAEHHRLHGPDVSRAVRANWQHDWSASHACCAECATTERPHMGKGLCGRCYFRLRARRVHGHQPRKAAKTLAGTCPVCESKFRRTSREGPAEHCSPACAAKTRTARAWATKRKAA